MKQLISKKKILVLLAIILVSLISLADNAKAQTSPISCEDNKPYVGCVLDSTIDTDINNETEIMFDGSCIIEIHYVMQRWICGAQTKYSIRIRKIVKPFGCSENDTILMKSAIGRLLLIIGSKFDFCCPENIYDVSVFSYACVKSVPDGDPNSTDWEIQGCGYCCRTNYSLTIVGQHVNIFNSFRSNISSICNEWDPPSCKSVCNANNLPDGDLLWPGENINSCTDSCSDVPWISHDNWNIFNIDSSSNNYCPMRIYYQYRECNNKMEYMINKIRLDANFDYSSFSFNQIYRTAIKRLVKKFGNNITTIRYRTNCLWKKWGNYLLPCENSGCCDMLYNYTLLNEVISTGSSPSSGNCDTLSPCIYSVCDTLVFDLEVVNSTEVIESNYKSLDGNSSCLVAPNPSNGSADLAFSSSQNGTIHIRIFDNLGNIAKEMSLDKKSELISVPIDFTDKSNGNYNYTIYLNNIIVGKGKFVISK